MILADVFVTTGSRPATITMTVPQSVILLAYNSNDHLTIGQLSEMLGLTFEYVCSCLKALLDSKLLRTNAANVSY
jgi:hypothetical protein